MRQGGVPTADDTRLSSDEIDALRLWLSDHGHLGDRADGAVTVEAIAEAYDVDPAEVAEQLRRLRAERAFGPLPPLKSSQRGLLTLALTMFFVAGLVYKLTPHHITMEEMDDKIREIKSRPHKIHYPVTKRFELGDANPPAGFSLELNGRYVVATASASEFTVKLAPLAEAQLARSLEALAMQAGALEDATPAPPADWKPRPASGMGGYSGNQMAFDQMGNRPKPLGPGEFFVGRSYLSYGNGDRITKPPQDQAGLAAWHASVQAYAHLAVQSALNGQNAFFKQSDWVRQNNMVFPPPGFSITAQGASAMSSAGQPITVLPLAVEPTVKVVREAVKSSLRGTDNFPEYLEPDSMKNERRKRIIPAFSTLTIGCPDRFAISVTIPTERSPKFPTMSDVIRGQDKAIDELGDKVRQVILTLNSGKVPGK